MDNNNNNKSLSNVDNNFSSNTIELKINHDIETEFDFKKLTKKEISRYVDKAYVYNTTYTDILNEVIPVYSQHIDSLGDSTEHVDIFKPTKNGMGYRTVKYELKNPYAIQFKDIEDVKKNNVSNKYIIIIRRKSNIILDAVKDNSVAYVYNIVPKGIEHLISTDNLKDKKPLIIGKLARYRIYLDTDNIQKLKEKITETITDTYDRDMVLNTLFNN